MTESDHGAVRQALESAVKANEAILPTDEALTATARVLADELDRAQLLDGADRTKALYLAPHLINVLREMHATPAARAAAKKAAGAPTQTGTAKKSTDEASALGKLRGIQGGKTA